MTTANSTLEAAALPLLSPHPLHRRDCWFWAGWEPDRYYRRIGARSTLFFGNGDWVPEWRAALESEETLELVAAAGGTVLLSRFYKGMGVEVERADWASLTEYVRQAHERGLRVMGYLQGRSLFGEFLFNERPEAQEWIARDASGARQIWGGSTNRFAPCLRHPDYIAMMEDIVEEGLLKIGLDGMHMDNNYTPPCYCERCRSQFRTWLDERGDLEELTGLLQADFVEPPPLYPTSDLVSDPIALLWTEFSVLGRSAFMQAIRRKVETTKPGAVLTGNPAFMRSFASRTTHSVDPALEALGSHGICIENGNRPRFTDGVLYTQADKLLIAEAAGLAAWVTSWAAEAGSHSAPSSSQALWATLAEEFSFRPCALGNNWALRAAVDGPRLLLEAHPELWQEFEQAMAFFRKLEPTLPESRRQAASTVVYLDFRACSVSPGGDALGAQAIIQHLFLRQIPISFLLPHQPLPKEARTIVIPAFRAFDLDELERLRCAAVAQQAEVWLLGEGIAMNLWGVPFGLSRRKQLESAEGIRHISLGTPSPAAIEKGSERYFRGTAPQLCPEALPTMETVAAELRERSPFTIHAPEGLLVNIEATPEGDAILHLRDLRSDASEVAAGAVRITREHGAGSVSGIAPGWCTEDDSVRLIAAAGACEWTLPAFSHYACITIEGLLINK